MRHLRLVDPSPSRAHRRESPGGSGGGAETRSRLIDAPAQLSIDDRIVIALRRFEELSEADMAEVLGVRRGTVKSRLSRAMTRLRTELEDGADE